MIRVSLHGRLLAESNETILIDGNHYFPRAFVRKTILTPSDTTTVCPWKGTASYYNAVIEGNVFKDVAWYYPHTISDRAKPIEDYIAFDKVRNR
ncbi:hypothetical protein CVT25_003122 [Psilocybe cyanescens]|uniref:DUF427 domain-containing protein n=1 Tax=Psilocybe cyanescens TaxID=93625 RepID=A0A409XQU3_PSICY|nr:hypothetical protein CVT25_003122 [Psilocybe cyanescens]